MERVASLILGRIREVDVGSVAAPVPTDSETVRLLQEFLRCSFQLMDYGLPWRADGQGLRVWPRKNNTWVIPGL